MNEQEQKATQNGVQFVCGVDEAGRGPLAGPVVAACVHIPPKVDIPGIGDSKALSEKKRQEIYLELTAHKSVQIGVGIVDAATIDLINILQATLKAMLDSVENCPGGKGLVLVDGNKTPPITQPCLAIVKGDQKERLIGAASIVAKHLRDQMMYEADSLWPEYGFAKHKGYGTKAHLEALARFGPCPFHRKTFAPIRTILKPHTMQH